MGKEDPYSHSLTKSFTARDSILENGESLADIALTTQNKGIHGTTRMEDPQFLTASSSLTSNRRYREQNYSVFRMALVNTVCFCLFSTG